MKRKWDILPLTSSLVVTMYKLLIVQEYIYSEILHNMHLQMGTLMPYI